MKQGWELKKLGDFYEITSSKRVFQSEWKKEGVPFYRAREIVKLAKYGFVDNELFISINMYNQYVSKYGAPKTDDIMVTGVGTLGICYVVKENDKFYFKDGNIIWFKKIFDINSRYVEYAFKSDFLRKQIDNSAGATVGTFTIIKAKNTRIPLPPLPEQKRIVAILDKAFAAIAKAKENAEKNLQNAKELFESYLQTVFTNRDEDWEEKKLSEVCELKPQKKEARDKLKETDSVTFLPMEDLGVLNKIIVGVKERKLKDVAGSYTYFANDDVLLAKITPCFENGKIGVAHNLINGIGFGSSEYIVFRSLGIVSVDYLYYFLSRHQFRDEGKNLMSGAVGHKRVSKEWVENYLIPFPKSLKTQQIITEKFDALSSEIKKLESIYKQKLNDLEELKKSILQKAFTGELTMEN